MEAFAGGNKKIIITKVVDTKGGLTKKNGTAKKMAGLRQKGLVQQHTCSYPIEEEKKNAVGADDGSSSSAALISV